MPSGYSNLNFHDRADRRRWQRICEDQRRIAKQWPAYQPKMVANPCEEYCNKLGPWRTVFCLAIFGPPMWTGSVSLQEQVGYSSIILPKDDPFIPGGRFETPQDTYLPIKSWEREHWDQAKYILSSMFGELIRPADNQQQARQTELENVVIWEIPYEGPAFWKERQH